LIDRWGCKPVLLGGAVIFAQSPALYVLSPSLWAFQIVRVFHGVGIGAFTTAYTALVAGLAPPARRGEAIGLSGTTNNLGLLFSPALGSYTAAHWGYSIHLLLAAGISAVSIPLLLAVAEPGVTPIARARGMDLRAVARMRPVWVSSFGITGLAVAYGAILSFLAPLSAERSLTAEGGFFTAFAVAVMLVQASAGWLSDRVGRRAVAVPGMAAIVLAMAGLAAAHSDAALLAVGAVFGMGWGLTRAGTDTAVVDAVHEGARGTALSILYASLDIGVGAGALGLGLVATARGYTAAFYAAAAWAAAALAGYVVWGRRKGS
jgi:predicted MFS family arabinose efflux permease